MFYLIVDHFKKWKNKVINLCFCTMTSDVWLPSALCSVQHKHVLPNVVWETTLVTRFGLCDLINTKWINLYQHHIVALNIIWKWVQLNPVPNQISFCVVKHCLSIYLFIATPDLQDSAEYRGGETRGEKEIKGEETFEGRWGAEIGG